MRLIVSSDIHGCIMPNRYSDEKIMNMGILKLMATMRNYKNENTIVIDNGDTFTGSPMTTYFRTTGYKDDPTTYYLNSIVDYYNVGNHDFDYGVEYLQNYMGSFMGKSLCGNVFFHGERLANDYCIANIENRKVAIIGCVTKGFLDWERKENVEHVEALDAFEFVKDIIEKLRRKEKPDLIVVCYHGGFENDFEGNRISQDDGIDQAYRMCKELDFDIMVSGHQHISLAGKCFGKLACQTKNNGQEFAVIDYDFEDRNGFVRLVRSDEEVSKDDLWVYENLEEETQKWLDIPLGRIDGDSLLVKDEYEARINKHPIISFINQVQKETTGSMLSSCSLFNEATGFDEEITMRDIVSTYVFENNLVVMEINGKTLREYLEKTAEYFTIKDGKIAVSDEFLYPTPKGFDYDMVDGIDYTIKVSNPRGKRIVELKYQGNDVNDDDVFTITINNYRAGGGGDYYMFKDCKRIKEIQDNMVTVLSNYFIEKKAVTVRHRKNIEVII